MAFVCRKLLIGAGVVMRQALKMATTPTSTSPIVRTTPPSSSSSLKVLGSYIESHSRVRPPTIIVILLLITFFLVGFLSIYLRRCYAHQHSTPPHHLSTTAQYQYHSHSQQGLVALAPTHHTAFVGSPKLPPRCNHIDLDSLPKLTFSSLPRSPPPSSSSSSSSSPSPPSSPLAPSVASLERQTECAICLEVFEDGVELCYLPLCGHLFHPDCIHMWLFTHTSCPLCRHSLRLLDPPSDGNATAAQPAPLPDHHYPSNRGDD